ncbi:hypothetical protein FsymDg_2087 [Candidatus Protofrankia datiscae]|uniref:Uncharacterized protein n=1 Tax=Candidatus Protofrankia datiscae TaxID=2716812 RepID=F8AY79_9ACTN|nr:hypothetical protein [Candidatus Protofrankia datiscae]AEH09509.1 hypothetical protein FsymDg_2087 [Candidatus Protofrankia datiscae]
MTGSDGNLYVAEGGLVLGSNVGRYNPVTKTYTPIPLPTPLGGPCDLTVRGNSIYFGEFTGNRIGKLTV